MHCHFTALKDMDLLDQIISLHQRRATYNASPIVFTMGSPFETINLQCPAAAKINPCYITKSPLCQGNYLKCNAGVFKDIQTLLVVSSFL